MTLTNKKSPIHINPKLDYSGEKSDKISDVNSLFDALSRGDRYALSRAITLIESTKNEDIQHGQELVKLASNTPKNSLRIGISGPPGVGKSTLIESLGLHILSLGKKPAILSIDPTSSETKGSILGDKTRMEKLSTHKNAYIRPSPSGEQLGGVTRRTRESIHLCEAAGYDTILVETVGVGQSETMVRSMVDLFVLLILPGSGDELQGIKRGIVELADIIVINKSDGHQLALSKESKKFFERAIHFYPPKASQWEPKVILCSALENKGIDKLWQLCQQYEQSTRNNNYFQNQRNKQKKDWFDFHLKEMILKWALDNPKVKSQIKQSIKSLEANEISPYLAAQNILSIIQKINAS